MFTLTKGAVSLVILFYKLFNFLLKFSEKSVKRMEQKIEYAKLKKLIKNNWARTRYIETENGTVILVKCDTCNPAMEELLMNQNNLHRALKVLDMPKTNFECTSITFDANNIPDAGISSILNTSETVLATNITMQSSDGLTISNNFTQSNVPEIQNTKIFSKKSTL